MKPLINELPRSDDVLYVFYDFETTQDTNFSDSATVHAPNLVHIQQFCSLCETQVDMDEDCKSWGKIKHSIFEDPVGDFLTYLCEPRGWCNRVVAIAHNARGFDKKFILQRTSLLKWRPEFNLSVLKIICTKMEHLLLIDSISYLPMPLRKLPEASGLSVRKSWYTHYFNTLANLNYVGLIRDVSQYGVAEMRASERREFMAWYEEKKYEVFKNRRVLEEYCQDEVTELRQACRIFRRDFNEDRKYRGFTRSVQIASLCNKVLRKKFLKSDTVGLISAGGYSCNQNYSKKALVWLFNMEQTDGCRISHATNGGE